MGNSFGVSPTLEKEYMKGVMKTKADDCQVIMCIFGLNMPETINQNFHGTFMLRVRDTRKMLNERYLTLTCLELHQRYYFTVCYTDLLTMLKTRKD